MAGRKSVPGDLDARKKSALRLLSTRNEEVSVRDIAQETGLDPRTIRRLAAAGAATKGNSRG